jgi:hypothetical protein
MNLSRGIQVIGSLGLAAYLHHAIGNAGDERNIRVLERHLGCSRADARRLYLASRQDGYGAAYRLVFPHGREPTDDIGARGVDEGVHH